MHPFSHRLPLFFLENDEPEGAAMETDETEEQNCRKRAQEHSSGGGLAARGKSHTFFTHKFS